MDPLECTVFLLDKEIRFTLIISCRVIIFVQFWNFFGYLSIFHFVGLEHIVCFWNFALMRVYFSENCLRNARKFNLSLMFLSYLDCLFTIKVLSLCLLIIADHMTPFMVCLFDDRVLIKSYWHIFSVCNATIIFYLFFIIKKRPLTTI